VLGIAKIYLSELGPFGQPAVTGIVLSFNISIGSEFEDSWHSERQRGG